jgi:fucose permease
MGWLHACFGIGAMLGTIFVSSILAAGRPWQNGYLLSCAAGLFVAGLFGMLLFYQPQTWVLQPAQKEPAGIPGYRQSLKLPLAWLGILLFFLYRGLEVSAGQWTFTLFTDSRNQSVMLAGTSVSLYWGGMTIGRILLGFLANSISYTAILRASIVGALAGFLLLTLNIHSNVNLAALLLVGIALAPLFPLLTSSTPKRVGHEHTANIVGFQIAGSSLGGSIIPSLVGILGQSFGIEALGPVMIAVCLLFLVLSDVLFVMEKRRDKNIKRQAVFP